MYLLPIIQVIDKIQNRLCNDQVTSAFQVMTLHTQSLRLYIAYTNSICSEIALGSAYMIYVIEV